MNHSATTNFPSLCVEYISMSFFLALTSLIYYKIYCHYLPNINCNTFFILEGITHTYLPKISLTHIKTNLFIKFAS